MARRVCVVITARASYARIRSALVAMRARSDLELQVVVAGSALLDRYGSAIRVIERDGFTVDRRVYTVVEGENLVTSVKSTGLALSEMATILDDLRPDAVVTIADRFETMATALAASYMNIPLVHVQGGEVTGSIDEKVRHAVTKLADLHLVASQKAGERVVRMGERADRVFVTGCPSIDVAKEAVEAPVQESDLFAVHGGVGPKLDLSGGYIVVVQHPVTYEYAASRWHVEETLHAVAELDMPTLWFWPNVDAGSDGTSKGIRAFRELHQLLRFHFFKNMPPEDFVRLVNGSRCLVGNSSMGIRECAFLGVPVVNIGSRQSGRDRGQNVIDVGYDRGEILAAIRRQLGSPRPAPDFMYGDGHAGERIAAIMAEAPLGVEKRLVD